MVHLLVIRQAKSFIHGEGLVYGVHEEIERNIDKKQYSIFNNREGYNTPTSCEWKFLDYRVKVDVVGDFTVDLGRNLNPIPNDMTLYKVFFGNIAKNEKASIGVLFKLVQWCFKWINRKKITSILVFLLALLFLSPFLALVGLIIILNPIKPVPVSGKVGERFSFTWHSNYILGMITDPTEKTLTGDKHDIL